MYVLIDQWIACLPIAGEIDESAVVAQRHKRKEKKRDCRG